MIMVFQSTGTTASCDFIILLVEKDVNDGAIRVFNDSDPHSLADLYNMILIVDQTSRLYSDRQYEAYSNQLARGTCLRVQLVYSDQINTFPGRYSTMAAWLNVYVIACPPAIR